MTTTTTTTSYGTWANVDRSALTVEQTVVDALSLGSDQEELADTIAAEYRNAINEALPEGVVLAGNEFYGPYYEADYTWDGELSIRDIVESIDLYEIFARLDHA